MKTSILISLTILVLSGCKPANDTHVMTKSGHYYEVECIDNVEYLRGSGTLIGHLKPDGSLYTCEG